MNLPTSNHRFSVGFHSLKPFFAFGVFSVCQELAGVGSTIMVAVTAQRGVETHQPSTRSEEPPFPCFEWWPGLKASKEFNAICSCIFFCNLSCASLKWHGMEWCYMCYIFRCYTFWCFMVLFVLFVLFLHGFRNEDKWILWIHISTWRNFHCFPLADVYKRSAGEHIVKASPINGS